MQTGFTFSLPRKSKAASAYVFWERGDLTNFSKTWIYRTISELCQVLSFWMKYWSCQVLPRLEVMVGWGCLFSKLSDRITLLCAESLQAAQSGLCPQDIGAGKHPKSPVSWGQKSADLACPCLDFGFPLESTCCSSRNSPNCQWMLSLLVTLAAETAAASSRKETVSIYES